jgi:hypothetical protein
MGLMMRAMPASKTQLFILYQMGSSEDWTWYSVIGVFLSEKALLDYAREKAIDADLKLLEPDREGEVVLPEPVEFVAVRSEEGAVPDVEVGQKI